MSGLHAVPLRGKGSETPSPALQDTTYHRSGFGNAAKSHTDTKVHYSETIPGRDVDVE